MKTCVVCTEPPALVVERAKMKVGCVQYLHFVSSLLPLGGRCLLLESLATIDTIGYLSHMVRVFKA